MATGTPTTELPSKGPQRLALLRLLQLASPALPVGAFAYSQGLESAVAARLVRDEASATSWVVGLLLGPIMRLDLAVFQRLHSAWTRGDELGGRRWNALLFASRPTAELQAEERHLASALGRVLTTLSVSPPREGHDTPQTFAGMFALACARWQIDARPAAEAFVFTWAEAQTSAAVRLIPLGQSAGVRMLAAAGEAIPDAVDAAMKLADDELGAAAPMQALLSAQHEMQYSRLFRS